MSEEIILVLISSAVIPALAWFFRDPWENRIERIERLQKLEDGAKQNPQAWALAQAEFDYERERRKMEFKGAKLTVYVLAGVVIAVLIGSISILLFGLETPLSLLAVVGIGVSFGLALGIRDYARSGPAVTDQHIADAQAAAAAGTPADPAAAPVNQEG
ncbi:hypothetical protein [Glutamicibacter sp. NPDC087583]|uniref:hypothetical protein n=1 Tax=Glutamicibacter sp. NPDC087583 TaxID=3363995 RepID=UPI0037F3D4E0